MVTKLLRVGSLLIRLVGSERAAPTIDAVVPCVPRRAAAPGAEEWMLGVVEPDSSERELIREGFSGGAFLELFLDIAQTWRQYLRVLPHKGLFQNFPLLPWPVAPAEVFANYPILRYSQGGVSWFLLLATRDRSGNLSAPLLQALRLVSAIWHVGRGSLPLHCSAAGSERGTVAFLGRSGAGKSTITRLAISGGYELIADDFAIAAVAEGSSPEITGWPGRLADSTARWRVGRLSAVGVLAKGEVCSIAAIERETLAQVLMESFAEAAPIGDISAPSRVAAFDCAWAISERVRGFQAVFTPDARAIDLIGHILALSGQSG